MLIRTAMGGETVFLIVQIPFLMDILVAYILIRIAIYWEIDMLYSLLVMASIAGIISCWCLFVPSFHEFSRNIQVITNDTMLERSYRGFGIGEGLTFNYGVILGSICALGICNIKKYLWFLFFIPFLILGVLVNARVGFAPIIISFALFFVYDHKIKYILFFIFSFFLLYGIWILFIEEIFPEDTLMWVMDFFEQLIGDKDAHTIQTILNTTIWPDGLFEWIFGKGRDVFNAAPGSSLRTDMGYLIQLCYGGVIYCVLLLFFVIVIVKPAYRFMPKSLFYTLIFSLLIENFKGPFIGRHSSFICFILIMMYYTQLNSNELTGKMTK